MANIHIQESIITKQADGDIECYAEYLREKDNELRWLRKKSFKEVFGYDIFMSPSGSIKLEGKRNDREVIISNLKC
jgi:hypothetical protein